MKTRIILIFLCVHSIGLFSQGEIRDTLSFYTDILLHAEKAEHRHFAHNEFSRLLLEKMGEDPEFRDSFDLLKIPMIYAPDSNLRIVSWQLVINDRPQTFGLVQFRGEEDIISLKDRSQHLASQEFGTLYPDRWLGAVYTAIHSIPGKDSLYLLRGFNRRDIYSTLHILEVLKLKDNAVEFGAPIFENANNEMVHRRIFDVANGASFNIAISDSLQRIVTDHLTAVPYNRNANVMVNVPDGTYEVLEWENGKWIYKERLFESQFQEVPMDSVPERKNNRDIFGRPRNN